MHQSCGETQVLPISSSSQDLNQSLHRTVNADNEDQFWSSQGTDSGDDTEWLLYKTSSPVFIKSFKIKLFKSKFHFDPKMVCIQVGNSPDNFHYCSQQFEVGTDLEQEFVVAPSVTYGCYFKLMLIGKKNKQSHDEKYYTALNYFGLKAV